MSDACPNRQEAIDLHAAGWLDDGERDALLAHARTCAGCREALAVGERLAAALRRAAPAPDLSMPALNLGRRRAPFAWISALAAAAALAVAVGIPPMRGKPRPSSAPEAVGPPTWAAYRLVFDDEEGLVQLLDAHARSIRFGSREPMLTACNLHRALEDLP